MNCFLQMRTSNLSVRKKIILSSALSWTFFMFFLCLFRFGKLPSFGISEADKYVHFTLHFVFTFLWGTYCWARQSKMLLFHIGVIVLVSFFYGILIEFLQEYFTETRHAEIKDVLANFIGSITAFGILFFVKRNREKQHTIQN